jgi:phosphoribosylglycinamide formyltransferase-1
MHKEFVSEPVIPAVGSFDVSPMTAGEPGLPLRFSWRGRGYEVARVLDKWRTTGPCKHGSGEQYVRRHWFRVETTDGSQMELYFDRQPRTTHRLQRWWLATVAWPGAE